MYLEAGGQPTHAGALAVAIRMGEHHHLLTGPTTLIQTVIRQMTQTHADVPPTRQFRIHSDSQCQLPVPCAQLLQQMRALYAHLVAQPDQALRQLVDVVLDAAAVGVEEVARHENAVLALPRRRHRTLLQRSLVIGHAGCSTHAAPAASSLCARRQTGDAAVTCTSAGPPALRDGSGAGCLASEEKRRSNGGTTSL